MNLFNKRKKDSNNKAKDHGTTTTPSTTTNENGAADSSSKYDDAVKTGSSIAKILTSKWNSQKKPGKVYVGDRRVHHGAIGSKIKLSKAFKKDEPNITGIISGIGEGLAKDDYADKDEWFKFNKKEKDESKAFMAKSSSSSTSPPV